LAAFEYVAVDPAGRRHSGLISADSQRLARRELRLKDLLAIDVKPVSEGASASARAGGGRLSERERVLIVRQLAALLSSGVPVESALAAVASDAPKRAQRALFAVKTEVTEGARLSEALRVAPNAFPPLVVAVVASGEASGRLGDVMERLATQLERAHQMRQKIQAALIYPAFLFVMALGMVTALLVVIVPRLVDQFELFGSQLPPLTRAVIAVSDAVRHQGAFWGAAILIGMFMLSRLQKAAPVARRMDKFVLGLPVVGSLVQIASAARFARVYATLAGSGATALEALSGARAAAGNGVIAAAADQIAVRVQDGGSLAAALKETGAFPSIMTHMVTSGEAGRDVAGMMERAAGYLDADFETRSATLLSLLEPVIILFLGGLIGLIVLAVA
jgi:general secretion pathway protein F